jgi:metal-responsive CopG/Arc/MetJ family transcriptional regulator
MITVLGIKIIDRIKEAGLTQDILSRYASVITTRLGFHEVTDAVCSREAYIILHLSGDKADYEKLMKELRGLGGIELREMTFDSTQHPLPDLAEESKVEILGILVERNHYVIASVQRLLTSYGCNIRTRLGVNEKFFGEPAGLIILELKGDKEERSMLEKKLKDLKQVHVRVMAFS